MNFRYLMMGEAENEDILLIHLADGRRTNIPYQDIITGNFAL